MQEAFFNYNWTGLTILKAENSHIDSDEVGKTFTIHGCTNFYQIGIKHCGNTSIMYNDIPYDYSAGHIIYIPKECNPDTVYKRTIKAEGDSSYIFFDSLYELPKNPFSVPCPPDSVTAKQFIKIANLWKTENTLDAMSEFYTLIKSVSELNKKLSPSSIQNRIQPAISYIKTHIYASYIDTDYLAKLCGMTSGYFKHRFKAATGSAPLQYINNVKYSEATKLLCENDYSIKDIAKHIGFTDYNYFSRFFKQHSGMTPSQYRKAYNSLL